MKKRISVDEALAILEALPVSPQTETVPLLAACGRVLSEDMTARCAVPPFARSPYDGYALRGADTASATRENPVTLRVTEELPAGKAPTVPVGSGMAAKILTGAPVPEGADAIVKYEDTEFDDTSVRIFAPVKPNTDIVPIGEDVAVGQLLAARGTLIDPGVAGVLAGQGFGEAPVYRRPRVAVMSTGSELLEPGQPLEDAKIYNSNTTTISAYLTGLGCDCVPLGSMPDEPETIARRIVAALESSDLVVTTGGASVGDYDYAVRAAELTGAELLFWKVAMKPGGSVLAAVKDGKLILCLSGNPGAAVIALLRLASGYVKRLGGRADAALEAVTLPLAAPFKKKSPQLRYIRGRLAFTDAGAVFVPQDGQGNGVVSSLIGCDLLGEIPAGSPPLAAGDVIKAYRV